MIKKTRLITLTGMTGVGKTTEFAHLGESNAYNTRK
jgi:flagellar biosynthesis GTPase FlhF